MFVKTFEYSISKGNFIAWKKVRQELLDFFHENGLERQEVLIRKENNLVKIFELYFFQNKNEYIAAVTTMGGDAEASKLESQLKKHVHEKKIEESEYETL